MTHRRWVHILDSLHRRKGIQGYTKRWHKQYDRRCLLKNYSKRLVTGGYY